MLIAHHMYNWVFGSDRESEVVLDCDSESYYPDPVCCKICQASFGDKPCGAFVFFPCGCEVICASTKCYIQYLHKTNAICHCGQAIHDVVASRAELHNRRLLSYTRHDVLENSAFICNSRLFCQYSK